jgi:hypothetical protein
MMNNAIIINTIEELKAFLNEKGVMEIALRNNNKRFKAFQKVMINNLPEAQEGNLTQKVINSLNKNNLINERNLNLLSNVAKIQNLGLLLNGLNLCATCAGFAIMYDKLDKMSAKINQQLYKTQKKVNQTQDIQNDFEFNKALSEHTNMLDSKKKQQPYSEDKMRELVDLEYNVLSLLINSLEKDVSDDYGNLIFSVFSLLSMFTVSLCTFDEIYYHNNQKVLNNKNVWQTAHDRWMKVYDRMQSNSFVEILQDYAIFNTKLNTLGVDTYYINLLDQVKELKEEIEDNQSLLVALGDSEHFMQYKEMSSQEITDTIKNAFIEAGGGMDENEILEAYNKSMELAALA